MTEQRYESIVEELTEVQSLSELDGLFNYGDDYLDEAVLPLMQETRERLNAAPPPQYVEPQGDVPQAWVRSNTPVQRASRKYKLLKKDVSWTTIPQVHILMAILSAHVQIGDIIDEEDIVKMMVANESLLQTNQGGKRIWDYYKGNSSNGLQAHGNVERI